VRAEVKPGRPEAHEILIARATHGPQELQIVDRLEKVGLSLAILTDDQHPGRWQLDLEMDEIAKVADRERVEPRRRAGLAFHHQHTLTRR